MHPISLKRTDNEDPDFKILVKQLDADLAERDGEIYTFYAPHNKLAYLDTALVAWLQNVPIGCGCFKAFDHNTAEIKRMFVIPAERGKGIASRILNGLELWAKGNGFTYTVLETGRYFSPEAVGLYQKSGYYIIDNYGPYVNLNSSICMKKKL